MIVYLNGHFVSKDEVRISPDDRGFLLADGVYEVIRSYNGALFRVEDHFRRLERSIGELRIEGVDVASLDPVVEQLLADNGLTDTEASVYIQVTRGAAPRSHSFPQQPASPTIYVTATPFVPPHDKWSDGIKAILVPDIRWTRCDIKSVALLPNVLASQQAKDEGAGEALFVRDGAVTEGTHTNFCAVFDGQLLTYPESHYILGGITRQVVLELCPELGIPVREFPVLVSTLRQADELMILGSVSEVMPIVQVDHWTVGDGKPGPVARKLQKALRDLVY